MKRPDDTCGSAENLGWEPCTPGIIRRAGTFQIRRRRRFLAMIAAGTVVTAIGGGSAIGIQLGKSSASGPRSRNGLPFLGGIACGSVVQQMSGFLDEKLDESVAEQITAHLIDCPKCRQYYTRLCRSTDSDSASGPRNPKFKKTSSTMR